MARIKSWVAGSGMDGNGRIVHRMVKLFPDGPDRYSPVYGYIINNVPYEYEEAIGAMIRSSENVLTTEEAVRGLNRMQLEYLKNKKQADLEAKGGVLGE